jgi:pimeloyl-ACP methyl ester carboxylesterase
MGVAREDRGVLAGGLPFNRVGSGLPVVVLQGLTFENRALSGMEVRFTMAPFRRLAESRSVYVVNRRSGLARGTSLSEMADDYAAMIRAEYEPPVEVIGNSSGGSIAFYLAAEHPDVVRRLVIQDCGCRLTDAGRAWGREVMRLAEAGEWRPIAELMMRTVQPDNRLGRAVARLFSPLMARGAPVDPTDMIVLLEAEDVHDFTPRLGEIRAPTLVACGELDPFSGAALAEETAARLPHGQPLVYPGQRHGLRGARYAQDLADFMLEARREGTSD